MRFNKFLWGNYSQTERGKAALQRYANPTKEIFDNDPDLIEVFKVFVKEEFLDQYNEPVINVDIVDLVKSAAEKLPICSREQAEEAYIELYKNYIPYQATDKSGKVDDVFFFGEAEEDWYDYVAAISLGLHQAHPGYFLPYDFRSCFHQLTEIHEEFGIPLAPVPSKGDKTGRAFYYLDINTVWQEFRQLHGLNAVEMCAFLYDFAKEFVTPTDANDLPLPTKAWIITGGAGNNDIETVELDTHETVRYWNANSGVRRGDILVMYLVRPKSCIHSIWRAASDGFVDPFFHYHSIAWIAAPIKTAAVPLTTLKTDPLLSKKGAIRANFQGPSSKAPLSFEEYQAIVDLMVAQGQDRSVLPVMQTPPAQLEVDLGNERDVEIQLIEPLLSQLGYRDKDWVRQMPVRMGRGERNYPDYAIGAVMGRGNESARMIIESKYQLSSRREFEEAFLQAKSYAVRLQCDVMALAAREGIWIFEKHRDAFQIEHHTYRSWGELNHPDIFHQVLAVVGRQSILVKPPSKAS
ncbi:MAG: hypothetical protein Q8M20_13830 [Rhodocyclaceae bacterium]|nr:hypothetical protein [Rhodocyclaceae bacterium]MDZ4216079.1 hypothetical protein [Rhodocyclaceae bacterium]